MPDTPPDVSGLPSAETVDSAYRSLIEFGVVGAVLAIIIVSLIAIVWWSLLIGRRREREHIEAIDSQAEAHRQAVAAMEQRHREERQELINGFRKRIDGYTQVLDRKDMLIEQIQEKRVDLAASAVEAIHKQAGKMEQLITALSRADEA